MAPKKKLSQGYWEKEIIYLCFLKVEKIAKNFAIRSITLSTKIVLMLSCVS